MKKQLKNLSKALVAVAALTLATGSAFAQLSVSGTTVASTCAIGFSSTVLGAATSTLTLTALPALSFTQANALTAAGPIVDSLHKATFFVKPTATTCISAGGAGTFNVRFSTTTPDTTDVTKAKNTATTLAANNIVIDLVPTVPTAFATSLTGMDLTRASAASQHGMPSVAIATGSFSVDARYWKTSAVTTTGTNVAGVFVATAEYQ